VANTVNRDLALVAPPSPLIHPRNDVGVLDPGQLRAGDDQRREVGGSRRLGMLRALALLSFFLAAIHATEDTNSDGG
jgi:hypothetical protein